MWHVLDGAGGDLIAYEERAPNGGRTMRYLFALMVALFGLSVGLATEVKDVSVITVGGLTLERSMIYLFEPIVMPKWDWTSVEPYQTNNPTLAKLYIDTARETDFESRATRTLNALQVEDDGTLWLGRWAPNKKGVHQFNSVFIIYAPRLWEIDLDTIVESEMLQYTFGSWWNYAFKDETQKEIWTGLEAFTIQQHEGKTQVYWQRGAYGFDRQMKGGRFYLVFHRTLIEDLKLLGKVMDEPLQRSNAVVVNETPDTLVEPIDAEAQYQLGKRYLRGEGIEQSAQKAIHWLQRAAEQQHAKAFETLGRIYFDQIDYGVEKNNEKAIAYFIEAAKLGNAEAQFILGKAYLKGKGAPQSEAEGLKWLFAAAAQENPHAQLELARYYKRQGNDVEAEKWLKRAEDNGLRITAPFIGDVEIGEFR